jgi:TonB family protein
MPLRTPQLPALLFLLQALFLGCSGDEVDDSEPTPAPALNLAQSDAVVVEDVPSTSKFALSVASEPEPTPEPVAPPPTKQAARHPVDDGKGLDAGQIRGPIKRNGAQVKACYERELKKNPGLEGKLVASFTIAPNGSVRSAKVRQNSTGSLSLGRCVMSRVKSWSFPTAEGSTDVEYPFTFEPRDF